MGCSLQRLGASPGLHWQTWKAVGAPRRASAPGDELSSGAFPLLRPLDGQPEASQTGTSVPGQMAYAIAAGRPLDSGPARRV